MIALSAHVSRRDHIRHRDRLRAAAERAYPIPRWLDSNVEWARHHHLDLPLMSIDELYAERRRVWRRADDERPPHPWLHERVQAIEAELRHRRQPGRPSPTPASPSAPRAGAGFEFVRGRVVAS